MPTTFSKPAEDDWVYVALRKAINAWHPRLKAAEVTFGVLMCSHDTDVPLKSGGFQVLACVKLFGLDLRALGNPDVLLKIDQREWDDMDVATQYALLDHELSHVDLKKYTLNPDGGLNSFDRDDVGRPKLKIVRGDWHGSDGFKAVVERHGADAVEFVNARRIATFVEAAKEAAARQPLPDDEEGGE